jgi:hypothetical protein
MRSAARTVEKRREMSSTERVPNSSRMRAKRSCSARASSAAVGSSRITNGASRKNSRASATFCHCPSDRSTPPRNTGPSWVA